MKIAIITDSGSGLTTSEAKELGIFLLPLQIISNGKEYKDGENITTPEVYDILKKDEMPTTSMPTMGEMEKLLKQIQKDGYDEVIAVPITAGLSSTSHVLSAVAKDLHISYHLIETYTTCNIQRYLAVSAKTLADQGLSAEEITARLKESVDHSCTLIIPDDLQHLKKGGRLTPVAAALGGLLKIKPILRLDQTTEGRIDVFDKVRTMSKAQSSAVTTFVQHEINEEYELTVLHADAPQEGEKLKAVLKEAFPKNNIYFGFIGAVISCHTGIGCMGIQYIKKVKGL